jgi:hypothetical protein
MSAEKPTPQIFIAMAALVTVLSTAAVVFAAVHGPIGGKPHGPAPKAHSTSIAPHNRHADHPTPWLIDATIWVVSIANRIAAA